MAVRRERVVLDLEDNFSRKMAEAAAATEVLKRELNSLSGNATRSHRPLTTTASDLDRLGKSAQRNGAEIDRMSGRMRIFADVAAMFGPSLVPIGAAGIGALAGFTNQLGMAATAAGVAVLAFHGVGDAVSALNKYQLEPTATNLQAVNEKMAGLAPAAQEFARSMSELTPVVKQLQQSAAVGLFPGLTDALHTISSRGPEVNTIISELSSGMGELAKEGAKSLASPQWDAFFANFEATAKPTLLDMGHAMGNVAKAAADLWVAFSPLTGDFSKGLVSATRDLERWTSSLSQTQGFQDFLDYVEQSGPKVLHLLGQIGNMFVQVAQALAPLGGPSMKLLGALADGIAKIADSDMGTPILAGVAALALFNRTIAITEKLQATTFGGPALGRMKAWGASAKRFGADLSTSMGAVTATGQDAKNLAAANERLGASFKSFGKGAALVGGLAFASSGLADKMNLSHTAMGAMLGMMAGPYGAAIGATGGVIWDFVDAVKHGSMSQEEWERSISHWTPAAIEARDRLDAMNIAIKQNARGLDLTSQGALTAAQSVRSFAAAVDIVNGRLSDRADLRSYQQSLDDFTESVKQNGQTLDINTQKGRDNQAALDNIAGTALKVAENLKGMDRVRYLTRARADFIDAATKVGMTRGAAIKLANQLHLVNQIHAKPSVEVKGLSAAQAQLDTITRTMNVLNGKHVDTFVTTHHANSFSDLLTPKRKATGGLLSGPGTGTSDSMLIRASNGEYVMRAAAVDRYGVGFFDALNAERYASGGHVPKFTASERSSARHAFDLTAGMSIKALENEFWQLAHTVKVNGGHLGKNFGDLEKRAKALDTRWGKVNDRLDAAKDVLGDLRSERDSLKSTVADSLTSNPFANTNVWASSSQNGSGIFGTLQGDIAHANQFSSLAKELKRNGVHGQALAYAESQGLGALQQLAGLNAADQKRYQQLYDQRAKAVGSAQHTAAQSLQPLINAQAAHVHKLESQLKQANKRLNRIEKAVEKSAHVAGQETGRQINRSASTASRGSR